jgi:hypothetical protein
MLFISGLIGTECLCILIFALRFGVLVGSFVRYVFSCWSVGVLHSSYGVLNLPVHCLCAIIF